MTIDERSRHALYVKLEQILGSEEATVLMEHLPPVGWADVATKRDLDALESRMEARFDRVDARFEAMEARFDQVDARFEGMEARFDAIGARFETVDARVEATGQSVLATLRADMIAQTRTMIFALSATVVSVAGLAFAAAKLT